MVLRRLLADLPADLPAAVLVVVHQPRRPQHRLCDIVAPGSALPVHQAEDSQPLSAGSVLLAPPDRHLGVVHDDVADADEVRQSDAPPRNGVRPSVDVLFESAAEVFRRRVVAVVLSGAMQDGAAGAAVVERAGGHVLVQDPADALVAGMPRSALAATHHHAVESSAGLGTRVRDLVAEVVMADA